MSRNQKEKQKSTPKRKDSAKKNKSDIPSTL